jgi:exodeoxyribonuclease VII large subunit
VAPNLAEWAEHVGRLQETLAGALEELLLESGEALRRLRERLDTAHPGRRLQVLAQRLDGLGERLAHCGPERLRRLGERVRTQELLLQSYNPRGILQRGYAIVRAAGGAVVTDTARLGCGDAVEVVLAQGEFDARVTGIKT